MDLTVCYIIMEQNDSSIFVSKKQMTVQFFIFNTQSNNAIITFHTADGVHRHNTSTCPQLTLTLVSPNNFLNPNLPRRLPTTGHRHWHPLLLLIQWNGSGRRDGSRLKTPNRILPNTTTNRTKRCVSNPPTATSPTTRNRSWASRSVARPLSTGITRVITSTSLHTPF